MTTFSVPEKTYAYPAKTESVCPECSVHFTHQVMPDTGLPIQTDELTDVWCMDCWSGADGVSGFTEEQKREAVAARLPAARLAFWRRYLSLTRLERGQVPEPPFPCPEELLDGTDGN